MIQHATLPALQTDQNRLTSATRDPAQVKRVAANYASATVLSC